MEITSDTIDHVDVLGMVKADNGQKQVVRVFFKPTKMFFGGVKQHPPVDVFRTWWPGLGYFSDSWNRLDNGEWVRFGSALNAAIVATAVRNQLKAI